MRRSYNLDRRRRWGRVENASTDTSRALDRRQMLTMGAAAGVGTWVAPAILRLDPVAAAAGSAVGTGFFLHDHPTPPTGDSSSRPSLGMDEFAPTATTLYNYDDDRDAFPGLLLQRGSGLSETDPAKYQEWRSGPGASPLTINGTATVQIYTAMKDFATGNAASITAGLYDCNGAGTSCSLIASGTLSLDPWPATWTRVAIDLGTVDHTFRGGRRMTLKLAVLDTSDDDLWIAYDTVDHPSCLAIT